MTVINRVWDAHLTGTVSWKTGTPDIHGIEYPGPGVFSTQASDFCVERGTRDQAPVEAELHGLLHNPVGLWQLDGDLLDSSPTGEDLSVATGTEQYGPGIAPGIRAAFFDLSTRLDTSMPVNAALQISGDLTVEFLVYPLGMANQANGDHIVGCSGADNSAATGDNFLWHFRLSDNGSPGLNDPLFLWEGPASTFHLVDDQTYSVPPGRWSHIACVRINGGAGATIGRVYINGALVAEVLTHDEPTGGGNSWVKVGDTDSLGDGAFLGYIQSIKVIAKALTAEEILAEARLTLPPEVRP